MSAYVEDRRLGGSIGKEINQQALNNMEKLSVYQKFEIALVSEGPFLEKAEFLRRKVFFKDIGRDEDRFDKFCQHLIVIEKETKKVVGTYRLLLRSVAEKAGGFYAQTKFNIDNIKKNCQGELLELGRACVDEAYRRYPIINLMWKEIISFLTEYKVKYIFGCASMDNPSPQNVGKVFRFFKDKYLSLPRYRVYPLEGKKYPYLKDAKDSTQGEIMELLPALIKGYLKMGALVCGEPAWNKIFDTIVFFMLLDAKKINISFRSKFLSAYAKDPGFARGCPPSSRLRRTIPRSLGEGG